MIVAEGGRLIGKVRDGEVDDKTWQLTDLDVQLDGSVAKEFHLNKTFGSPIVSIATKYVGAIGDKIILKGTTKEIGEALNGNAVPTGSS